MICRKAFCLSLCVTIGFLFLLTSCDGFDGTEEANRFDVTSEPVIGARSPVAMAFAPDGRLFYAEQYSGDVYVITPESESPPELFVHVDVAAQFDWGLTGVAIDPDFESNGYVYLAFMEPAGEQTATPVVVRFKDEGGRGVNRTTIVGDLQETDPNHKFFDGAGSIHFGPDGFLYMAIGDYDVRDLAQDLSSDAGKILRVDKEDGSAPLDNPFVDEEEADPRIFAYGFRKPFHFAFHPETDKLYMADDGPVTCDELNIVEAGKDYGWPATYESRYTDCEANQVTQPLYFFALEGMEPVEHLSVVRPRGIAFASASVYPGLDDSLIICEEITHLMRRLVLAGADQDQVIEDDVVTEDCQIDVAVSPDGIIYYSNAEEIRRLTPISEPDAE